MSHKLAHHLLLGAAALSLPACLGGGGGGGGSSLSITPPPLPPSPPTPPPPPAPPAPFGLSASQQFATYGTLHRSDAGQYNVDPVAPDAIKFSWSADLKAYEVTIPGFEPGRLDYTFPGNNNVAFHATSADGKRLPVALSVMGTYGQQEFIYSSYAYYSTNPAGATDPYISGMFAYGVPTAVGDVPKSGTANYNAKVEGATTSGDGYGVIGEARLTFDFGAGSLSGYMRPRLYSDWDGVDRALGQYDFTQTVYAPGNTAFSGRFIVPDAPSDSAFHGRFTGPGAAELIAGWRAPYLDPFDNKWKTMGGFWIGKKQ